MNTNRKLALIRRIDRIEPIPNADAIECAYIGGWPSVIKKGQFNVGDLVVYCEIDSWIPHHLAPFLSKEKDPREYNKVKGERLRTMKLRGCLSQGLILPVDYIDGVPFITADYLEDGIGRMLFVTEGDDVTEALGIQKWEAPIPAQLAGQVEGAFPSFIPKTDQERIQNLASEFIQHKHESFEITYKLDGSSCTIYYMDGHVGICSRNLELKINEENKNNSFIATAERCGYFEALKQYGKNIAIQAELMGPGIQGNREALSQTELYVYDVYDIDNRKYLTMHDRQEVLDELDLIIKTPIKHVPWWFSVRSLDEETIDTLLAMAEGPSWPNEKVEREGLVFKSLDSGFTFKAISNKYLLEER